MLLKKHKNTGKSLQVDLMRWMLTPGVNKVIFLWFHIQNMGNPRCLSDPTFLHLWYKHIRSFEIYQHIWKHSPVIQSSSIPSEIWTQSSLPDKSQQWKPVILWAISCPDYINNIQLVIVQSYGWNIVRLKVHPTVMTSTNSELQFGVVRVQVSMKKLICKSNCLNHCKLVDYKMKKTYLILFSISVTLWPCELKNII